MGVEEGTLKKSPTVPLYRLIVSRSLVTDEVLNHQYNGSGTAEDPYRVEWLENDHRNPLLFPSWIKWLITFLMSVATLSTSFSSSALSGASPQIIAEFKSSKELTIADTSLFVLAFAIGPAIWAPLSELYGRQSIFIITFMMTTLFSGAIIASQNITTILVLRFFAGAFGSSILANGGGVISDIFTARERGLAAVLYLTVPFLGPSIGGIAAGFVSAAAGWRWLEGLITILNGIAFIAGLLLVPETYAPFLLQRRAAKLSKITGKVYKSRLEIENGHKTTGQIFRTTIVRPLVLLFREPIVFSLSIYMAISKSLEAL
jgi:MFS family permease